MVAGIWSTRDSRPVMLFVATSSADVDDFEAAEWLLRSYGEALGWCTGPLPLA
jgi:hypothetical protein